jgi:hypothetical protein
MFAGAAMRRPAAKAPTGLIAEVIEMIGFRSCLVAQVIEISGSDPSNRSLL